jgi:hypothetical protein
MKVFKVKTICIAPEPKWANDTAKYYKLRSRKNEEGHQVVQVRYSDLDSEVYPDMFNENLVMITEDGNGAEVTLFESREEESVQYMDYSQMYDLMIALIEFHKQQGYVLSITKVSS